MASIKKLLKDGTLAVIKEDGSTTFISPDGTVKHPDENLPYQAKGAFGESVAPQGSIMRSLFPTREELPAVLSGTVGGAAASANMPGLALASLYAGGGEALKQVYEHGQEKIGLPRIFQESAPTNSSEAAARIGKSAAFGGLSEGTGRALGGIFSLFSRSSPPAVRAGIEAAKTEGIIPPLSARTEAAFPQALERLSETSFLGGAITNQKRQALRDFGDFANRVGQEIGPNRPPETVTTLVNEQLKNFDETFKSTKDKIYGAITPKVKNIKVNPNSLVAKLNEIIDRRSGDLEPAGLSQLKETVENIVGKETKVATGMLDANGNEVMRTEAIPSTIRTVEELRKFRTNLGQKIGNAFNDPASTGLKSDLESLYSTASDLLDKSVKKASPALAQELDKADEFYSLGLKSLKDKLYRGLSNTSPDRIYATLFKPDSPQQIRLGREILGDDVFDQVKRQWFDDLLSKSMVNKEGERVLSPQKLATNMANLGKSTDAIFENDSGQLARFQKLEQVANLMARGREVTQGSQTAFLMQAASVFKNSLFAALAKGIETEAGKQLLSTAGFPKVGYAVERSVQPFMQTQLEKSDLFKTK